MRTKLLKPSQILSAGGIGVFPTDTLYGLVASALNKKAVERVYAARQRTPTKPCIILIADIADLAKFEITPDKATTRLLNRLWPGAVSVVLPCKSDAYDYLHRGTHTLAFRLPQHEELREFLRHTGPLIAPSANREGEDPATTVRVAQAYFSDQVDFYEDAGTLDRRSSTLVRIIGDKINVLRQGGVVISNELIYDDSIHQK